VFNAFNLVESAISAGVILYPFHNSNHFTMKTILASLFCCLAANMLSAQSAPPNYQYIPMVVENAHWTVAGDFRAVNGPIIYEHHILRGDTTIGTHTYKKLYSCPGLVAGLREDINTHKVYVYPFNNYYYNFDNAYPVGAENLLIDVNQDTAPQASVPWLNQYSLPTNAYLFYQNNNIGTTVRRTLRYQYYCNLSTIEGIGFGNGGPVLHKYCPSLSCQSCGEQYFYVSAYDIISPTQNCSTFVDTENKQTLSAVIALFPNPTTGTFHIQNLPPQASLTLYDALGKKVDFIQKESEINIASLPNGIYFIHLNLSSSGGTGGATLKLIKTE
jgi:Secretion system C-terminal sorting domain